MIWKTTLGRLLGKKFTLLKGILAITYLLQRWNYYSWVGGKRKKIIFEQFCKCSPTLGADVSFME